MFNKATAQFATARNAAVDLTRVRLHTGVEIDVAHAGDVTGIPVLFLHGYTDSWVSFGTVLQQLPATIRAIVPTQRGHGDSERPGCCYHMSNFAADAVALLDALRIDSAVVVGHSMGSFISQRMALDYADRVSHLVLIGSGTTPRAEPVVELNEYVQAFADPVAPDFIREFQESTAFKPLPAAFLDAVIAESSKVPARVWQASLEGLLAADMSAEIHRITAPTLVIWGEEDELWPRGEQEALLRAIRSTRLAAYAQTGHATHWEQPARFAADLVEFLGVR